MAPSMVGVGIVKVVKIKGRMNRMASCRKKRGDVGQATRKAIATSGEDPQEMSKKDRQEWLDQVMWEISLRLGQWGDTYEWTLKVQTEDDEELEFEGGCGI